MFLTTWFTEGGIMVWAVLGVSAIVLPGLVVGAALGIGARAKPILRWPARLFATALFLFSTLVPCAGVLGWVDGIRRTDQAAEFVRPDKREELVAMGRQISRYPMYCGSMSAMVTMLPAFFLLVLTALPGRDPDA